MVENPVFKEVRFLKDSPSFIIDDLVYGPFKSGKVYALPVANANLFVKQGVAEEVRVLPKKPTLKELFKGEVLTGYVEAGRVRPLTEFTVEEKERQEEILKVAKFPLDEWGVMYAPHLKEQYAFEYNIRGNWNTVYFKSLEDLNSFLDKGKAELYVPHIRGKGEVFWNPTRLSPFRYKVDQKITKNDTEYSLTQPFLRSTKINSHPPFTWIWRITVYDRKTYGGREDELSETELDDLMYISEAKNVLEVRFIPSAQQHCLIGIMQSGKKYVPPHSIICWSQTEESFAQALREVEEGILLAGSDPKFREEANRVMQQHGRQKGYGLGKKEPSQQVKDLVAEYDKLIEEMERS